MKPKYDIIVAGCGCAGFAAAVQAARLGKSVLLVEKNGMPGGILTVGGNNDIAQFSAYGRQIIAGIGWEYVKRLESQGAAVIPDQTRTDVPHWHLGVRVNIPMAAAVMDEMLLESGVDLCYEQFVCDARTEPDGDGRRIRSIRIATKSGLRECSADTWIDCTGDGDLSVFAGADAMCGEPDESGTAFQPGTVRAFLRGTLSDAQCQKVDAALARAIADGTLRASDTKNSSIRTMLASHYNNVNHISRFNGADSDEKTRADIEGRQCVARLFRVLRSAGIDPDLESMSPETAVRESRRIVCDTCITAGDYLRAARYPDGVCHAFYPIDLHRDGTAPIRQVFLSGGRVPSIPLSAMTVRGLTNLFVAGRCISSDRLANSAIRVKASCMAMGQACGAAAALACAQNGGRTRALPLPLLRQTLAAHGAIVPDFA